MIVLQVDDSIINKSIHHISTIAHVNKNQLKATTIDNINNKKYSILNKNHTHTYTTALSHHVFLNKLDDSVIASCTHMFLSIIRGKEKNVNISHNPQVNLTIMLVIIESFQKACCINSNTIQTVAVIDDHAIIFLMC